MKNLSILLIALLIVICPILGRADTTLISQQVINIGCVYAPPTSGNTTYTQILQSNTSVNVTCNNNIGNINLNPNQSASIQCLGNVAGNVSPTTLTLGSTTVISCNPAGGGGSTPTGPAGGDLGGTYPNPTVTSGAHVGSGTLPNAALVTPPITACSGDMNSGCSQVTGGTHLGAGTVPNSALAVDPTNASNLSSGVVAAARGGAGTVSGALKGNGSGTVSQSACSDLSNGATGCSTTVGTSATVNTGTSGATIPLNNGVNTWSGVQTFTSPVIFGTAGGCTMSGGTCNITNANITASCKVFGCNDTTTSGALFTTTPGSGSATVTLTSGGTSTDVIAGCVFWGC